MVDTKTYTIWDTIDLTQAAFTAANATETFTSAAHGLSDGMCIQVKNSGGALPTGLSALTNYYVITATTNTFQLSATKAGSAVTISDDGSGTNTWLRQGAGKHIYVGDFQDIVVTFDTDGGADAALTVKFVGSVSLDAPDFDKAQSTTNQWDYVEVVDLEDGSAIDGDTGVAVAGADDHRQLAVNVDNLNWFGAIISGRTEGEVKITTLLTSGN